MFTPRLVHWRALVSIYVAHRHNGTFKAIEKDSEFIFQTFLSWTWDVRINNGNGYW